MKKHYRTLCILLSIVALLNSCFNSTTKPKPNDDPLTKVSSILTKNHLNGKFKIGGAKIYSHGEYVYVLINSENNQMDYFFSQFQKSNFITCSACEAIIDSNKNSGINYIEIYDLINGTNITKHINSDSLKNGGLPYAIYFAPKKIWFFDLATHTAKPNISTTNTSVIKNYVNPLTSDSSFLLEVEFAKE